MNRLATITGDYPLLVRSFQRALLAANRSPRTVSTYLDALDNLGLYLSAHGMPTNVAALTREHVEAFIGEQVATKAAATAATRFQGCHVFFKWLVEEGELASSPMARMHSPTVPQSPPPVLTAEAIRKLLKACDGRGFFARRDTAIVRLLLDTGMRRTECARLSVADIDLDLNVARVFGKGRKVRACPFGRKAALALDRYLRVRLHHRHAALPALWLGRDGGLGPQGFYEVIRDRGRAAGLELHPHLFRHYFSHIWLAKGGQEGDLMQLNGWQSRSMLARYGASAAAERARDAYRRGAAPGDEF